ncbi:MAG: glycosyltransferase [Acidobacteria bacterium]|nr:glycosyltransferase [Acidobacteriota bacterium]
MWRSDVARDARPGVTSVDPSARVRLLTFTTLFAIGGTERHLMNLTEGLDHARFDLEFACLRRQGEFLDAIKARGLPVREYPVTNLYGPRALAQELRFARALKRWRVDIVHTYNFYPNVFALPAARLAGTPVVIASIRDTGPYLTPRQRVAQRVACRFAHHVLVNADAVRRWLVEDGYSPANITVIRNGLDLTRFTIHGEDPSLRRELGLPPGAPVVAMLSRLDRLKGVEDFLDAAARVAARVGHVHFLIIGDKGFADRAEYRRELEARAARLGLARRVVFTGFRMDVPRLLALVAVSVLPSLSEGLSNTLLESMAAGIPVVATRVGGNPEVVEHGATGWLVPPHDPEALGEAIASILQDPSQAKSFGRRARERVAEQFSLERMVRETERFYERALLQARRPEAARAVHRPVRKEQPDASLSIEQEES